MEENELEVVPTTHAVVRRGDGFDIGQDMPAGENDIIVRIMQNPGQLQDILGLTGEQAENIRAALTGAGTAASHKLLGRYFGDEIASVIGAAISSHIARKITRR